MVPVARDAMLDGIYSLMFRGHAGFGAGMIILQNGVITGADAQGALYDGSYVELGTDLRMDFTITVPPGVTLVQGTPAKPEQYTISDRTIFPRRALDSGEPVLMDLPPGPVNVIFRRLRALGV
jgi:hypothetical protein